MATYPATESDLKFLIASCAGKGIKVSELKIKPKRQ